MGADGTPTEEIDRVAESQMLASLEQEGVDWDVVSEEIGFHKRGGGATLVVDPIDGSHNVLRSLPFATVSLALGRNSLDGIEVGLIRELHTGSTFWAMRGGGAFRDGHPIRVRPWVPKSELFFLNLGRHSTPRTIRLAERARRVRSLGCASLEIALVSQGGADAYLFENDTPNRNLRVTDVAAAYRILLEAGGGLANADGADVGGLALAADQRTSLFALGDPSFAQHVRSEGYL